MPRPRLAAQAVQAAPALLALVLLCASAGASAAAAPRLAVEVRPVTPEAAAATGLPFLVKADGPTQVSYQMVVEGTLACPAFAQQAAALLEQRPAASPPGSALAFRPEGGMALHFQREPGDAVAYVGLAGEGRARVLAGPTLSAALPQASAGAVVQLIATPAAETVPLPRCDAAAPPVQAVQAEGPVESAVLEEGVAALFVARPPALQSGPDGAGWRVDRVYVRLAQPGAEPVLLAPGATYHGPPAPDGAGPPPAQAAAAANATFGAVAAGLAAAGAAGAAASQSHRWRDWALPFPLPLLWLFTRLQKHRLLEHPTRRRVHETIEANPGIRFADLRALAGLPTGVLTHHLRVLQAHGLVHSIRRGRQRHLFTEAPADPGRPDLTDAQRRIVELLAQGVRGQAEIARRANVSQQTVSYHLRRLRASGLVERGPEGAGYLVATRAGG